MVVQDMPSLTGQLLHCKHHFMEMSYGLTTSASSQLDARQLCAAGSCLVCVQKFHLMIEP